MKQLAPQIRLGGATTFGDTKPDCDLREATRAGEVQFGLSDAYEAAGDVPVTRCYGGALVRYTDDGREVTVVSDAGLHDQLRPAQGRQRRARDEPRRLTSAGDLVRALSTAKAIANPVVGRRLSTSSRTRSKWIVLQLCLVVALVAVWKGRRIGPLVAEQLPVVVRASETVEGRGRLYRSRRARDRAAEALRTAALQRMMPRLGLGHDAAASRGRAGRRPAVRS